MSRHVSPRDPCSTSEGQLRAHADDPWLDDQVTTLYKAPAQEPRAITRETKPGTTARVHPKPKRLLQLSLGVSTALTVWMLYWLLWDPHRTAATTMQETSPAVQPALIERYVSTGTTWAAAPGSEHSQAPGPKPRNGGEKQLTQRNKPAQLTDGNYNGRPATLSIDSHPWSEVTIDDKPLGRTPLLDISLQPGRHKVRLFSPQASVLKLLTLHALPGESIKRLEQLNAN